MEDIAFLWPEKNRSIWEIQDPAYKIEIKWQRKPFEDYKLLAQDYAKCGYALFAEIIQSGHDNEKSDMWFLPSIYLMRQSLELGLKALHCRVQQRNPDIQAVFVNCGHDLSLLFSEYISKEEDYLTSQEKQWLIEYLNSVETVDSKSDMFRFPFGDDFLSKYRNEFLDNVAVANNMCQAAALINKCLNFGRVENGEEFDDSCKPSFLVFDTHGIGNCYLWQPLSDAGFYAKVTGYMRASDYLFYHCSELSLTSKVYPIFFMLRNALELCLKRIFYSRVDNGVPRDVFLSKRKSHLLIQDLWRNVRPVITHYASMSSPDLEIIDIVENRVVGMKSRGVYETPGGTILYEAHQQLEELVLDRATYEVKKEMGDKLSQIVYEGKWFTPLREAVQAFIESTQEYVTGEVKFKLYKGNISKAGTTSPYSLYSESLASFTTGDLYDHHDASGFINLFGLPLTVRAMKMQENENKK